MHGNAFFMRGFIYRAHVIERDDRARGMRVFDDDQRGRRDLRIAVIGQAGAHGCRIHGAVYTFRETQRNAGQLRIRTGFMVRDMRMRVDHGTVAAPRVRHQRAGVALHA